MFHKNREWTVVPVKDAGDLTERLTQHTWCCCNGFLLGEYLFLNDSTGPDGAQEYGVAKMTEGQFWPQIESLTVSWMDIARMLDIIRDILDGKYDGELLSQVEACRVVTPELHGVCRHCA